MAEERGLKALHGVVTRAQAITAGHDAEKIKYLVQSGSWRKVHRGVYLVGKDDGYLTTLAAAVLPTGGVVCRCSAARLLTMDAFDSATCVHVAAARRFRIDGFEVSPVEGMDQLPTLEQQGFRLTTPLRTLVDLGDCAHMDDVEAAVDYCVRTGQVSWADLISAADARAGRGRVGPAVLRRILDLRSYQWQHTDSLLETRSVQLVRYARFPRPVLQFPVLRNGVPIAIADLAWPQFDLLVELMGAGPRIKSARRFASEVQRSTEIARLKTYTTLAFTWGDVHRSFARVCMMIAEAMGQKWNPSPEVKVALGQFGERIARDRAPADVPTLESASTAEPQRSKALP